MRNHFRISGSSNKFYIDASLLPLGNARNRNIGNSLNNITESGTDLSSIANLVYFHCVIGKQDGCTFEEHSVELLWTALCRATSDFVASLIQETFWIIRVARPTELMASKRNPTVSERSALSAGARYQPAKSASEVSSGNGLEFQNPSRSGKTRSTEVPMR